MSDSDQIRLANYFKALSSPQRLKLFLLIYNWSGDYELEADKKGCCCPGVEKAFTKVCECLSLSRSTISHHFKVLESAGLINCVQEGQKRICTINPKAIELIKCFTD